MSEAHGRFAHTTIDTFDVDRTLVGPVTWNQAGFDPQTGTWTARTFSIEQQRRSLHEAKAAAVQFSEQLSGGLYLCGPFGSGKTHLGSAIAGAIERQGWRTHYDSTPALLRHIRRGFDDHSADERIEFLQNVQLLMLDDLGAEHLSNWGEAILFDITNERYRFNRPVIITTNLLLAAISGRIASRLAEMCQVVPVIACDHRLTGQQVRR